MPDPSGTIAPHPERWSLAIGELNPYPARLTTAFHPQLSWLRKRSREWTAESANKEA